MIFLILLGRHFLHLAPSVPETCSKSILALSRIKQVLKLHPPAPVGTLALFLVTEPPRFHATDATSVLWTFRVVIQSTLSIPAKTHLLFQSSLFPRSKRQKSATEEQQICGEDFPMEEKRTDGHKRLDEGFTQQLDLFWLHNKSV